MRWLLLVATCASFAVACGSKTSTSPADAATDVDAGGGTCHTTQGDVGNCFANVTIDSPSACGFSSTTRYDAGPVCDRLCGASAAKCCVFDGKSTVRCEQCACP